MFLPVTREEMNKLGWDRCDVILVTGDAYIDSPYIGTAVIGKYLAAHGYKVGIIAQPDYTTGTDITALGEPALFWGVTGGCVDSMVSNFTASLKRRKQDDFTPGGINNKRPDNASIVYCNLIRKHFKNTRPIVMGGIEASLRRIAHYDYVKDAVKRSILFDAKADYIVYGMGEKTALKIAQAIQNNENPSELRGLCYISGAVPDGYTEIPSFEEAKADREKFLEMFMVFYNNGLLANPKGLAQKQDTRYLVQNPPQVYDTYDLDEIYGLDYERDAHPSYKKQGVIRALDTIRFSITTHRGCFGNCAFCAISSVQGTRIIHRTEDSIIREAEEIAALPDFKGYITDLGGPTANMYGMNEGGKFKISHKRQINLLRKIRAIKGVKKVFVASGIRYDLIFKDEEYGIEYLKEVAQNHVSGQLKVAPEHSEEKVLKLMNKPGTRDLLKFKTEFEKAGSKKGLEQYLTYYFIAAYPGCGESEMKKAALFVKDVLKTKAEQVQIFTPTPSTLATAMYYTGKNPITGETVFVEKNIGAKEWQKRILTGG
ncbi:MAG TPA: YgiQ family radical SAM protein [Candidatus Goldiibacteriota bacterium]|nr:YgiQ family radical SAM protein [Candidatus Goldiibacteriota bacterium]